MALPQRLAPRHLIGGLCIVHDGDQPRFIAEGQPHVIMPLIRKERVQLLGNWTRPA